MISTEAMLKNCWEGCANYLRIDREIYLHSVLVDTEREMAAVLLQPAAASKDEYAAYIYQSVQHLGVDAVFVISEAWAVECKKGEAERASDRLEDHPNRVEIVMIAWKTADGSQGVETARILRDSAGHPSLDGKIDKLSMSATATFNRFLDGLFITGLKH